MAASAPAQTDIRVPVYAILYSQEIPTVGTYSDTITLQLSWQ
jgi:spore coat protein U-like protein